MTARVRSPITGKHVLVMIIAFFATVILVNATFITLAVQSFPGEDVKRSYLQGLNYNQTIAERRAERALGWRALTSLTASAGGARLEARLYDTTGRPIDALAVEGVLRRPTESAHDIALVFVARGEGAYVANAEALPPGIWDLRATARRGEQTFSFTRRLSWAMSR